jgi:hypothetical protein
MQCSNHRRALGEERVLFVGAEAGGLDLVDLEAEEVGALGALAGVTKFAPFALIPLLAAGPRAGLAATDPETGNPPLAAPRLRVLGLFALGLAGVAGVVMLQTLIDPGIAIFFDRTIASQIDRDSPFSVWGQTPSLDWLQLAVQIAAAGLAILVAFVPRRRTLVQVAALAAGILIAVQLTADHWFYLYIVWFAPAALLALCGGVTRSRIRPSTRAELPARVLQRSEVPG